jgi:hypothetical protein
MRKRVTRIVSAAALLALVGVGVAVASAESPPGARVIQFTAAQTGGFLPHGRPHPGSVFGTTQRVAGDDGSKGSAMVLCTFITDDKRFCRLELILPKGLITLEGVAYNVNRNAPLIVNGGTGAYSVARGSATVNDMSRSTTEITLTLPR